jgi:hypothetical protein
MSHINFLNSSIAPVLKWGHNIKAEKETSGILWGSKKGLIYDVARSSLCLVSDCKIQPNKTLDNYRLANISVSNVSASTLRLSDQDFVYNEGKPGDVLTNRGDKILFETTVKETSGVVVCDDELLNIQQESASGTYFILNNTKKVQIYPPKIDGCVYRLYCRFGEVDIEGMGCEINYMDWKDGAKGQSGFLMLRPNGFVELLGIDGGWTTTKLFGIAGI